MTLEALIALGMTKEQAEATLKLHKDAIDGNYVPKATFEAERTNSKTLKQQVEDRDKQITELGKFKGTAEELTTKVTDLEKKNKEDAEKHAAELEGVVQEAALRSEIGALVHDADDVISKLDRKVITFKDGKVEAGLKEQLETLKKSKPHYFKEEKKKETGLPEGWSPFGKTPAEGGDDGKGKGDEAANFGAELAKVKSAGETAAAKAADIYFK